MWVLKLTFSLQFSFFLTFNPYFVGKSFFIGLEIRIGVMSHILEAKNFSTYHFRDIVRAIDMNIC